MTFAAGRGTATSPGGAGPPGAGRVRPLAGQWRKRRTILVGLCVAAVVAAAVLVDLPEHSNHGTEVRTALGVIAEITGYVKPCSFAVGTALRLYARSELRSLTGAQRSTLHSLATTDYAACSFTDQTIVTLATVHEPSSPSGRDLNRLVSDTLTWCSTDAMQVIGYVSDLIRSPANRHTFALFVRSERRLDAERRVVATTVDGLGRLLHSSLPQLKLVDADVTHVGSGAS